MTTRELINELLNYEMDTEVSIMIDKRTTGREREYKKESWHEITDVIKSNKAGKWPSIRTKIIEDRFAPIEVYYPKPKTTHYSYGRTRETETI